MTNYQTTPEAAIDVLSKLHENFPQRRDVDGSFRAALIQAMFQADLSNLALLGVIYPAWANAVYLYKNVDGGYDYLLAVARGETDAPNPTEQFDAYEPGDPKARSFDDLAEAADDRPQ